MNHAVRPSSTNHRRGRAFRLLAITICLVLAAAIYVSPLDIHCVPLLVASAREVPIPLPWGCSLASRVPQDQMVEYLENDRKSRGLDFKSWITCPPLEEGQTRDFPVDHDARWMPSYDPGTLQFHRVVIVSPYAQPIPRNSPVVAEVALTPWLRYISEVSGECHGKYSVWITR